MWPPNLCIARRSPKKFFEPGNVTSAFPFPHLEGKLLFRACMTHRREHLHHPSDLSKSKFTRLWTLAAWTGAKITAKLQSCSDSDRSLRGDRSLRAGSSSNRKRGKEEKRRRDLRWKTELAASRPLSASYNSFSLLSLHRPSPEWPHTCEVLSREISCLC